MRATERPRPRRAPPPRRGEGRGEGAVNLEKPLPPSPGSLRDLTSPPWGEVEQVARPRACPERVITNSRSPDGAERNPGAASRRGAAVPAFRFAPCGLRRGRDLGALPLPDGERVGVRGQ